MSQNTISKLNITQNHPDFKLNLKEQPFIFKYLLFEKTLNSIKENPKLSENYRTITIKCLFSHCK